MGIRGLKENIDRALVEKHPSLAKTTIKVADFFNSKEKKTSLPDQRMELESKENVHEN